jgi:Substrate binding domain of ABC-type glycine betaine transport system
MTFAATGKPAFGADTVAAVFQRILNDEPTIAAVPSPFREVIARCLDKDPHARPAAWDIVFQLLGHQDVEAASSAIELPEGVRGPDRLTVDRPERGAVPQNATRPDAYTRPDRTRVAPRRWTRARTLVAACSAIAVAGAAVIAFVLWPDTGSRGSVSPGRVTVGSANFAKSALLAEIYAQALEAKGYRVTRRFSLGARETYYEQVRSGQIDVIPEYSGALATFLDPSSDVPTAAQVRSTSWISVTTSPSRPMTAPRSSGSSRTASSRRRTSSRGGLIG